MRCARAAGVKLRRRAASAIDPLSATIRKLSRKRVSMTIQIPWIVLPRYADSAPCVPLGKSTARPIARVVYDGFRQPIEFAKQGPGTHNLSWCILPQTRYRRWHTWAQKTIPVPIAVGHECCDRIVGSPWPQGRRTRCRRRAITYGYRRTRGTSPRDRILKRSSSGTSGATVQKNCLPRGSDKVFIGPLPPPGMEYRSPSRTGRARAEHLQGDARDTGAAAREWQ